MSEVEKTQEERLGPFSCSLEKVLEMLSLEAHESAELGDEIIQTFLLKAIYYVDETAFNKYVTSLIRRGFSKRILRAAQNLIELPVMSAIAESILDNKLFGTEMAVSLRRLEEYFGLEPGETNLEYNYLLSKIDVEGLQLKDCLYGMEDFCSEVLAERIPGGSLIETESKFGASVERLLKSYGKPQHNVAIRQAFVKYTIGAIDKNAWAETIKPHKRQFSSQLFDRLLNRMSDELFDMFGKMVKFNYSIEDVCSYIGKRVTPHDYYYMLNVLGDEVITPSMIADIEDVEEIPSDFFEPEAEPEQQEPVSQETALENINESNNEIIETNNIKEEPEVETVSTAEEIEG